MSPSTIVNSSWMTLASGARQCVVHDALEITCARQVHQPVRCHSQGQTFCE
eukprot:m.247894 g.247894  ORF g.247894 m.247894 type:complete len:51 (-) comp15866_c0_seq3:1043-1195(-)